MNTLASTLEQARKFTGENVLANVAIKNGSIVSTDGFRLFCLQAGIDVNDCMINVGALKKIKTATLTETGVTVGDAKNMVYSTLNTTEYPDYTRVIPSSDKGYAIDISSPDVSRLIDDLSHIDKDAFIKIDRDGGLSIYYERDASKYTKSRHKLCDLVATIGGYSTHHHMIFRLQYFVEALETLSGKDISMRIFSRYEPVLFESQTTLGVCKFLLMPVAGQF
jgi:DNA polymerase III sliding clamp (beta) subunit (PCNA family)